MNKFHSLITAAYEQRSSITSDTVDKETKDAIFETIELLDKGELRVAEKKEGQWVTHQWIKQAILLAFRLYPNQVIDHICTNYYDKIPLKYTAYTQQLFQQQNTRVVPPTIVRKGAYLASDVVLMSSFVNIGAYIDSKTMIDTWAAVGSCAQIGKNVHISAGVFIGGVLEPLQSNATIIEDNCFIGVGSVIAEGVVVEENSVISMGVLINQSTPIYDRQTDKVYYGRVPAGSVIVSGSLPSKTGHCHLCAAIIVKQVDAKTRSKTSINDLLRV